MITTAEGGLRPRSTTRRQLAPLVGSVALLAAIAVAAAVYVFFVGGGTGSGSVTIEGRWLLFDGLGSESMVFDREGRATSMPASPPYVIGTGELDGERLTIRVTDIGSPVGEYSTSFHGARVQPDAVKKYLPPEMDETEVEAVYFGQFVRSDLPEFVIPVAAIKLR